MFCSISDYLSYASSSPSSGWRGDASPEAAGGKAILLPACEVKSLNTLFLFLEYFFRFLLCVCFKKNGGIIDNTKETIIFVARRKHHE